MIPVNYLAVVLCTVAAVVIGSVWYSPKVFYTRWAKLNGSSDKGMGKGNMTTMMTLTIVASLVEAYVLAHFIHYAGATTLVEGVKTGVWVWLGFLAGATAPNYIFGGKPRDLYLIDMGYHLVVLAVMGAIIVTLGV